MVLRTTYCRRNVSNRVFRDPCRRNACKLRNHTHSYGLFLWAISVMSVYLCFLLNINLVIFSQGEKLFVMVLNKTLAKEGEGMREIGTSNTELVEAQVFLR